MSKIVTSVGRIIGGVIAGKAGAKARKSSGDPVIGAAVGAASIYVAGKLLPRRLAGIGAALAAGYVTRKLAQRAERITSASGPANDGARLSTRTPTRRRRIKGLPAKP